MPNFDKKIQHKKRKINSNDKENLVDIKQHVKRKKISSDEKGKERNNNKNAGPAMKKKGLAYNQKGKGKGKDITTKAVPSVKKQDIAPNEKKKEFDTKKKADPAVKKQELISNIKLDWNNLRIKSIPDKDRPIMIEKLMKKITGHVAEVTLRHDASRIVQSIFQFGTTKQRIIILDELLKIFAETCKTPYGHFAVLKAMSYCTQLTEQKKICNALTNKFVSLAIHSIGARTVETLMQLYPSKLTTPLKAEFYGKKFTVLLETPPKDLQALLQASPTKRSAILDHMRDLITRLIQKGLFEFKYVHQLLWEYTQEIATSNDTHKMEELITNLSDFTPKLLTTKNGAKTCCMIISHSLAKDRKKIIKSLKGKILESLLHDAAHLGVMRLVDVTDDTIQIQKILLSELILQSQPPQYTATGELIPFIPPLLTLATNRYGSKLLLRLLSPKKRHLEPDEEFLFHENVSTSKKSFAVRRLEHLAYFKKSLISLCSKYTEQLLRNRYGSKVIEEVVKVFLPSPVITAIGSVVTEQHTPQDDGDEEEEEMFPETYEEENGNEDDVEEEYEDEYYENAGEEGGEEEVDEEEDGMQVDTTTTGNDELGDIDEEEGYDNNDTSLLDNEEAEEEDDNNIEPVNTPNSTVNHLQNSIESLLPIYEDPIVHQTVKKLLKFEKCMEEKKSYSTNNNNKLYSNLSSDVEDFNEELWDVKLPGEDHSNQSIALGKTLLVNLLNNQDLLLKWLATNRGCFVVTEACKIPSLNTKSSNDILHPLRAIVMNKTTAHSDIALVGYKCLHDYLNNF